MVDRIPNSQRLSKATVEVRIRIGSRSSGSSRRNQRLFKVLPFLVENKNDKTIIVARGKAKESRPAYSPQLGVNHSGRIRSGAQIQRFEFSITHLLQKRIKNVENLTVLNQLSAESFSWTLPRLQLSFVCLKKRKIVSCSKHGVHLEESPRFFFHTAPMSTT